MSPKPGGNINSKIQSAKDEAKRIAGVLTRALDPHDPLDRDAIYAEVDEVHHNTIVYRRGEKTFHLVVFDYTSESQT